MSWKPQDLAGKAEQIALLDSYVAGLRDLAPDMGAYVNEVRRPLTVCRGIRKTVCR